MHDDELLSFELNGAALPSPQTEGYAENEGARIWYAAYGTGSPVILLHGGMGHSGNWGHQVPALARKGYRTIVIDSRGHGRSTRDEQPYSYELMGRDVLAVMDSLGVKAAPIVGWSDGACTGLSLAKTVPSRIAGVLFFACNVDNTGTRSFEMTPVIGRCIARHRTDYEALSSTPTEFDAFMDDVGQMQRTQPNYAASDLRDIHVPVTILQAEHDEFIRREHAEYLAQNIPVANLVLLPGVSHFAPLQRPEVFNAAMLNFLSALAPAVVTPGCG